MGVCDAYSGYCPTPAPTARPAGGFSLPATGGPWVELAVFGVLAASAGVLVLLLLLIWRETR